MPLAARDISLICQDDSLNWKITKILVEQDYTITTSRTLSEGLGKVYEVPPALIIMHEPLIKGSALRLLRNFKKDTLFSHIPALLLTPPEWSKKVISWDSYPVEDFIATSFKHEELLNRIGLCLSRYSRTLDPNPLTRLPGNTSIMREIQQKLDLEQRAAICYVDIDNFKAFNDKYGFARGDEALRMTARILSNVIRDYHREDTFVGHVGGDDFVFIVPAEHVDDVCGKIIARFDSIIPNLYDDDDRKRGSILSKDRQGKKQRFPLMTISIAIVVNDASKNLKHYGEVSEAASQIKKHVKKKENSNYMLDRRKG